MMSKHKHPGERDFALGAKGRGRGATSVSALHSAPPSVAEGSGAQPNPGDGEPTRKSAALWIRQVVRRGTCPTETTDPDGPGSMGPLCDSQAVYPTGSLLEAIAHELGKLRGGTEAMLTLEAKKILEAALGGKE